jgi:hypothetical protein
VTRLATRTLAVCALLAVTALAGCGQTPGRQHRVGETEGIYVTLGELKYQIQISRQLNPADIEDRSYLRGLPEGVEPPTRDETWFAIFIRVENDSDEQQVAAETFEIEDTQEKIYRPVLLDERTNVFAYQPRPVAPDGGLIPDQDSAAGQGVIQGALLLFKLTNESLQNRPLEFRIKSAREPGEAIVDIDV